MSIIDVAINNNKINEKATSSVLSKNHVEKETTFSNSSVSFKLAVRGFGICHSYKTNNKVEYVLDNLSINIPAKKIYGLLGPSGCGKTTLLRIITGLVKPENGTVKLFGFKPGFIGSGSPGTAIGYMPQDVSLQSDLTVNEMLYYFGRLYFIPSNKIQQQIDYLVSLLEIPKKNKLIAKLSGGQQRRCSLACAIIHKPRLAILDEPTVGVDPILCNRIWNLLQSLSKKENTTIIITTHYIEECQRADFVGFIRKGQIIKEDNPQNIIKNYKTKNLEEAFYQICLKQKQSHLSSSRHSTRHSFKHNYRQMPNEKELSKFDLYEPYYGTRELHKSHAFFVSLYVLVWRYFIQTMREPVFLLLLTLYPISTLAFLYTCIGQTPQDLLVAWITDEKADYQFLHLKPNTTINDFNQQNKIPYYPDVLKSSLNSKIIKLIDYQNLDQALKDVENSKIKAAIHISSNFSESFNQRIDAYGSKGIPMSVIKASNIEIFNDQTNRFISSTIEITLQLSLLELLKQRAILLNISSHASSKPPIELGEPIYGEYIDEDYFGVRDFAAPGYIIVVNYGCALAIAGLALIKERNDKMFERNYSIGISKVEIILAQVLGRFIFLSLMSISGLLISIYFFQIPCYGSFILAVALILIQTLAGMANGMILTIKFTRLYELVYVTLGSIFLMFFFSGVFWPVESLPYYFRWVSKLLPFTMPAACLRSILIRKNAPFHPLIWPGFAASFAWFVIFIMLTIISFKDTLK